jgi:hypothetical protein
MKQMRYVYTAMILMVFILASGLSYANQSHRGKTYAVTITNLTRGQVFSPPIVISHKKSEFVMPVPDQVRDDRSGIQNMLSLLDSGYRIKSGTGFTGMTL